MGAGDGADGDGAVRFSRYHAVETSGLELIGKVIDQWDEWGYRPILMSQVVRTLRSRPDPAQVVMTTLVFEKREQECKNP
jgi:hypothetical protein